MTVAIITIILGILVTLNFVSLLIFGKLPTTMKILACIAIGFSIAFSVLGILML